MLKMTTEDLSRALLGLSANDKAQLLRLLELRDQLEQDAIDDPRPPLELFVRQLDPRPLSEDERRYFDALPRPRLEPVTTQPDAKAIAAFLATLDEAPEPEPNSKADPRPAEEGRQTSAPRLPRDVEDDVAQSRARDRAPRQPDAGGEPDDPLRHFRGQAWLRPGGHHDD